MPPFSDPMWLLIPIVLLSFTTEAMTGFGSIVIAVTLGANLVDLKGLLPVLVTLNIVLSTTIVSRHHRHVDRRILLRWILPLCGLGVLAGLALFQYAEGPALKRIFGVLVVVFALRELWKMRPAVATGDDGRPGQLDLTSVPWLLLSGLTHGLYASGGPLLVYAMGRLKLPKAVFRATLSSVWWALNIGMTTGYLVLGALGTRELTWIAIYAPLVVLGIVLGEWLHHRIDEQRFRLGIFSLLVVAGGALAGG